MEFIAKAIFWITVVYFIFTGVMVTFRKEIYRKVFGIDLEENNHFRTLTVELMKHSKFCRFMYSHLGLLVWTLTLSAPMVWFMEAYAGRNYAVTYAIMCVVALVVLECAYIGINREYRQSLKTN